MNLLARRRTKIQDYSFHLFMLTAFFFPASLGAFTPYSDDSLPKNGDELVVPEEKGIEDRDYDSNEQTSTLSNAEAETTEEIEGAASDLQNKRPSFDFTTLDDNPETLKKLDKGSPIWCSSDRKRVALGGEICLRHGSLEFFACRRNTKDYESIIALDSPPHLIHAALLAIGAKQGTPAKFDPVFVPPTGDKIAIEVRWFDEETGQRKVVRAQELVAENESGKEMSADWVFTGGLFGVDPDGKKYYLANATGEIFGVSNFPGSVLDVPFESTNDSSNLYYTANTRKIPVEGTPVLLILTRIMDGPERGVLEKGAGKDVQQ